MKVIISFYNRCGYRVVSQDAKGRQTDLYSAGNHVSDSTVHAPVGSAYAVSLRQLRRFAIQTGKSLAAEKKLRFAGVERIEDSE